MFSDNRDLPCIIYGKYEGLDINLDVMTPLVHQRGRETSRPHQEREFSIKIANLDSLKTNIFMYQSVFELVLRNLHLS